MKIHEYQAKELFRKNGVAVPDGSVAFTVDEAKAVADRLGAYPVVVKAQIHAGGRGLGGGVKVAKDAQEFDSYANSILGMNLVTKQTGPGGKRVQKLLIEQGLNGLQFLQQLCFGFGLILAVHEDVCDLHRFVV